MYMYSIHQKLSPMTPSRCHNVQKVHISHKNTHIYTSDAKDLSLQSACTDLEERFFIFSENSYV
jgi:hypothetical protein